MSCFFSWHSAGFILNFLVSRLGFCLSLYSVFLLSSIFWGGGGNLQPHLPCRTLDTNYYIWSVFQHTLSKSLGHKTMAAFWQVLNWSLGALYQGKYPTHDPWGQAYSAHSSEGQLAGKYLAGGFRGVLWVLKGSWECDSRMHLCKPLGVVGVSPRRVMVGDFFLGK